MSTVDRTVRLIADAIYQDPQPVVEAAPGPDDPDREAELDWSLVMVLFKPSCR